MGLNALISIDLKTNSSEKINHFNKAMQEKEWSKIDSMDHTWVSSFNDGISREKALEVIQSDVTTIKQEYDLETLSIAVQLSEEDIVQGDF